MTMSTSQGGSQQHEDYATGNGYAKPASHPPKPAEESDKGKRKLTEHDQMDSQPSAPKKRSVSCDVCRMRKVGRV
jgi:hypothetical protein